MKKQKKKALLGMALGAGALKGGKEDVWHVVLLDKKLKRSSR